jgi:hypothetical protein
MDPETKEIFLYDFICLACIHTELIFLPILDYTLFFILVSGLREIFSRQVEFRDF